MHVLQPKHSKLSQKDNEELLGKLNVSKAQLPKIFSDDPALPEGCDVGDIIKIEKKNDDKIDTYYRVVV
ncbi:MAG TPA: DNA-directed RNA polymerase subunit H [Candidatus Pacearchaeota archaeon]|nr:DNA-directed RNA polymerase subunit H [archaeon BMS3Abin17]HDK42708.1 DNA-directed RNA polymerase subunit H [Candidatus Pacearchaeota archaeon]HDZ60925.1 DNA-directed RNA polymerase subunit H [Candidatus Pacearchaeota archaeon]